MISIPKSNSGCLVVGLDCSTTSAKAVAFDKFGTLTASASVPIPLFSPQPHFYEQEPLDWWHSAQHALRSVTHQVDPKRIVALAISNQRETFVPLDRHRRSLRPAIVWLDERCKDEVKPFSEKVGVKKIHRLSGKPPDYAPAVYRLAWMKRREPDLFRRISMVCDVHAYLAWKLTGSFKTSWASADPLGLFDLKKKQWSPVILDALDLQVHQLPEANCPGTVLGTISRDASTSTGLGTRSLVIAGGGDGQAAGLGSNALTSKRAYLNLGTAVVAGIYGAQYRTSRAFRTMCSCSEGGYYYESSLRAGTFAIDWFIRNVLKIDPSKDRDIYHQLEQEAQQVPVGSDGLLHLPYLCGVMNPFWDIDARGAFVGLSASHHRGHMYRSILEGIAFEELLAIRSIEEATGSNVNELVAIGGGATSRLWCQILADITGKNICIPGTTEASALGAAMAAAVGVGLHPSFSEAARRMSRAKEIIKPDLRHRKRLNQLFDSYKALYPSLRKL